MTARTRIAAGLVSVIAGVALGASVGFFAAIAPALSVASVTVTDVASGRVTPTAEMVEIMTDFGVENRGLYVEAECYAAPPATACIATYIVGLRMPEVPWIFIAGPGGLRAY